MKAFSLHESTLVLYYVEEMRARDKKYNNKISNKIETERERDTSME